jgi:hypothetical protein
MPLWLLTPPTLGSNNRNSITISTSWHRVAPSINQWAAINQTLTTLQLSSVQYPPHTL